MGTAVMIDNLLKTQAFKLKGRLHTLTVLQLLSSNIDLFEAQLSEVVASAPRLFDKSPVVIDCSAVESTVFDLSALCQRMRAHGMIPIAVSGNHDVLIALAEKEGLPILHASATHDKPLLVENQSVESVSQELIKSKLVSTPVRSGQQVVSKGGDLVITSSVSHGAELLADGNIHVYGALRGRALAGIAGDKNARIFCQSLDAELVSIAGIYCLSDKMPPIASPCQIFLQDDRIQIETL